MSLATQVLNLATRIGTELKAVYGKQGDLADLATTHKSTLVGAINEAAATGGDAGAAIDDSTTDPAKVWSSSKTSGAIAQAKTDVKAELVNGAPAAFDTLKELADYVASDQTAATATATALGNRVRVDAAQALDATQKAQARTNIGAAAAADLGDPETDLVAAFNAALA